MVPPILRPPDLEADIRSSDPKAFSLQVFKTAGIGVIHNRPVIKKISKTEFDVFSLLGAV
jgi:hypothetical protein